MEESHSSKPNGATGNLKDYFTRWIEGFEALMDERDRRYEARFHAQETAVSAAFQAQRELNRLTSDTSERAIQKAEEAQTAYNIAHNQTIPRTEQEARFRALDDKIAAIRDETIGHVSGATGAQYVKSEARANIAIIIAALSLCAMIIMAVLK